MDAFAPDTTEARNCMVDGQIRPNRVSDPRILQVMRTLPRERFLPPGLATLAYIDADVDLGGGRVLVEPMAIARLVQLLAPLPAERVLVIGAGTGYGAALLAACGAAVTALEEDARLIAIAEPALAAFAASVLRVRGPLAAGWPQGAPWDAILIEGAVHAVPEAIVAQLRDEGRLATVLAEASGLGRMVLAERTPFGLAPRREFDCATKLLPQFRPKPAFIF